MYDINCLIIFIIKTQEHADIRSPTDSRQASIQLTMYEDRIN
jgi:hypothetical protein